MINEYDFKGQVKDIINEKKLAAEQVAEENLKNAFNDNEFSKHYKHVKSLIFDIGKANFLKKDTSKLKEELKAAKAKIKSRLAYLKINADSLKPNYECSKCNDGAVENCECFKKEFSKLLLQKSGIGDDALPDFASVGFDFITDAKSRDTAKRTYKLMQDYVAKINNPKYKTVTITGGVGRGKTHLLKCIVNESIKQGKFVVYSTAFNFNRDMLKYHLAPLKDKEYILQPYLYCDLMLLDDLGTESILKNVSIEYLYLVLNERVSAGLPTIVTTNLDHDQIEQVYDLRIASRLFDNVNGLPINMEGDDLRKGFNRKENGKC